MKLLVVAAAISTLADREMTELNVSATDADALGNVMTEAEGVILRQLIREGMSLKDAQDLVDRGATTNAKPTPESEALLSEAVRNRHLPMPQASQDGGSAAIAHHDAAAMSNSVAAAAGQLPAEHEPLPPQGSQPAYIPAAPAILGAAQRAAMAAEVPLIPFKVHEKSVFDIFPKLDRGDVLFDFKLPYLEWDRPHPNVPKIDPAYLMDVEHLHTVLYATAETKSLNIVGPHGCGKTEFVKQVGARLNLPVSVLPMDGQLTRSRLIGQERIRPTSHGPESFFEDGLLPKALREPGFILFDEVDRGVSDLQYACHSVYLQDGLTILEDAGRHIPFHAFNRVIATSNTKGRGSMDGMYQAAEEMSEATRDRFSLWIDMDYQSEEDDLAVIQAKIRDLDIEHATIIAKMAHLIRNAFLDGGLSQTCSMRQQLEAAEFALFMIGRQSDKAAHPKLLRKAIDRVIMGRASPQDKTAIETMLQPILPAAF